MRMKGLQVSDGVLEVHLCLGELHLFRRFEEFENLLVKITGVLVLITSQHFPVDDGERRYFHLSETSRCRYLVLLFPKQRTERGTQLGQSFIQSDVPSEATGPPLFENVQSSFKMFLQRIMGNFFFRAHNNFFLLIARHHTKRFLKCSIADSSSPVKS